MTRPPVRWTDSDLPEALSRAIASAGPTRADAVAVERMRARLQQSIGPAFEGAVPKSSAVFRAASMLQYGKWLGAVALAAAGLAFWGAHERSAMHAVAVPPAPVQLSTAAVVERQLPAVSPDPQPTAAGALDLSPAPSAQAMPAAEPKARVASRARTRRDVQVVVAPDKSAAQSGDDAQPAQPKPGLAEELQGLTEIRGLLKTAPARALTVAEQQQQRFARGALGPERELLRIEALLRTGQVREAKLRAARAFSAVDNPYRDQIEKLFARAQTRDRTDAAAQAPRAPSSGTRAVSK